jgi:hypothetical protein
VAIKGGKDYNLREMISREDINKVLDNMILSASGWRGVFRDRKSVV